MGGCEMRRNWICRCVVPGVYWEAVLKVPALLSLRIRKQVNYCLAHNADIVSHVGTDKPPPCDPLSLILRAFNLQVP